MTDAWGRTVNYLRISITDRCPLRCRYCQPDGAALVRHEDLLTYEELLRVAEAAVTLGINRFKVTGGEPLVRRGAADFIARLRALPGAAQVTLTTNGLLLADRLDALHAAGLDGLNLSLDALSGALYREITGCAFDPVPMLLELLERSAALGIRTKVNTVLLRENEAELVPLAELAARLPVDVRFIERMPLGAGAAERGLSSARALTLLRARWPDLHPVDEIRGNGPARYFASRELRGRLGMIDALSHRFCAGCNRLRLTSTGSLKPCLCYEDAIDLRAPLRRGADREELAALLRRGVLAKPRAHRFETPDAVTERRGMSGIGG